MTRLLQFRGDLQRHSNTHHPAEAEDEDENATTLGNNLRETR